MAHSRIYELLERVGSLVRASERSAGQDEGLQPVQLNALAYLARCNRYSDTPRAVTEYLGTTKGTASQTLQRLQDKSMVISRPDRTDGRVVHLRPSAKGKRVLQRTTPPALLRHAATSLSDTDAVEAALVRLLLGLQRAPGVRSFGLCSTCRYHERSGAAMRCGLTEESLSSEDASRICIEHELAS
jgi:DNA-binding MarR family transcriptional regulator